MILHRTVAAVAHGPLSAPQHANHKSAANLNHKLIHILIFKASIKSQNTQGEEKQKYKAIYFIDLSDI